MGPANRPRALCLTHDTSTHRTDLQEEGGTRSITTIHLYFSRMNFSYFFLFFEWFLSLFGSGPSKGNTELSGVYSFTNRTEYGPRLADGQWLILFHHADCSQCIQFMPSYGEFATVSLSQHAASNTTQLGRVDCKALPALCAKEEVRAVPSFKLFKNGTLVDTLSVGSFTKRGLLSFVTRGVNASSVNTTGALVGSNTTTSHPHLTALMTQASQVNTTGTAVVLTEANYDEETREGPWLIAYSAPWCGHCRRLALIWNNTATALKHLTHVGSVDCTKEESICKRYSIRGYPTIMFRPGPNATRTEYWGQRSIAEFTRFVSSNASTGPMISTGQLDELLEHPPMELTGQRLMTKGPRPGLFLYLYSTNMTSDGYDQPAVAVMSALKNVPTAFFFSSDHELISRYSPQQVPALLYFNLSIPGINGTAPAQLPPAALGSASETLSWALDQIYPGLMAIDGSIAPLLLARPEGNDGSRESRYLYLAIVNPEDTSLGTTLLPDLEKLTRSVRPSRPNLRFAYMNGPTSDKYLTRAPGAPQDALPRYLIVDLSKGTLFDLAPTTALQAEALTYTLEKISKGELQGRSMGNTMAHTGKSMEGKMVPGTTEMVCPRLSLTLLGSMLGISMAI